MYVQTPLLSVCVERETYQKLPSVEIVMIVMVMRGDPNCTKPPRQALSGVKV